MYNKTFMTKAVRNAFSQEQVSAFVRLFKAAPASTGSSELTTANDAVDSGLIFIDKDRNVLPLIPSVLVHIAKEFYGNESLLFNQTFYKSFATTRDASPYKLLFDQLAHYMTTYGAESVGVKMPAYVPIQSLELPENMFNENFKAVVIQILPDENCIAMFDNYLKNLTAPSENILEHVKNLLPCAKIATDDIKSFEVQIIKHDMDGTVPSNPISQLRYLVYTLTGSTLIIKNRTMRESIKNSAKKNDLTAYNILKKCERSQLASIFLRYKPIFLALKAHKDCAPLINTLRRLADLYHKPLSNVSLQNFTSLVTLEDKAKVLIAASNRDLVKVLNSLYNRMIVNEATPGVFAIRNGRTFIKENGVLPAGDLLNRDANMVLDLLVSRLTPILKGKKFFLPEYIHYTVPTTEKQFIGDIPYGTCISADLEGAFTAGVHWFDQEDTRVDIDLHMNSATRHFGWNGSYRDGSEVLYTGDQTAAPLPNGAAEAYWFTPTEEEPFIVTANLYSGPRETKFKFFMNGVKPTFNETHGMYGRQSSNYTYNPNDSLFPPVPMKFVKDASDMTLGIFIGDNFYFYGGTLSSGIVPNDNYQSFIKGLSAQIQSKADLRTLLIQCGAIIIPNDEVLSQLEEEEIAKVISLAPEAITAETLFDIIDGNV